jgi:hypothetical protein
VTRKEALTLALKLAIAAPSEEKATEVAEMAESIACGMDATAVDHCKALALAEIATTKGER